LLLEAVGEGSARRLGVCFGVDLGVKAMCGESGSEGSFCRCHGPDCLTRPFRSALDNPFAMHGPSLIDLCVPRPARLSSTVSWGLPELEASAGLERVLARVFERLRKGLQWRVVAARRRRRTRILHLQGRQQHDQTKSSGQEPHSKEPKTKEPTAEPPDPMTRTQQTNPDRRVHTCGGPSWKGLS